MKKIMKKIRVPMVITGVVAVLVGLLICGAAFAVGDFQFSAVSGAQPSSQVRSTVSLADMEIRQVEIDSGMNDVIIEPAEGEAELTFNEGDFTYEVQDGRLVIQGKGGRKGWIWYRVFNFTTGENNSLVLRLPREYAGDLSVSGGLCETEISGLRKLASLKCENKNGAISLEGLGVQKEAYVYTGMGDVFLGDCAIGAGLTIESSNGSVDLAEVDFQELRSTLSMGDFTGSTLSGDQLTVVSRNGSTSLVDVSAPKMLRLESSLGDIDARGIRSEQITVDSSAGAVRLDIEGKREDYKVDSRVSMGDSNLVSSSQGKYSLAVTCKLGACEVYFSE